MAPSLKYSVQNQPGMRFHWQASCRPRYILGIFLDAFSLRSLMQKTSGSRVFPLLAILTAAAAVHSRMGVHRILPAYIPVDISHEQGACSPSGLPVISHDIWTLRPFTRLRLDFLKMLDGYQRRWAACTTEPRFGEVRLAFLIRKSTNRDDIMPPCIFGIETHIASLFLANDNFICTMVRLMMSFRKQYHSSRIREELKTSSFTPRLMSNHTSVRATVSSAKEFHRDASPHRPTVLCFGKPQPVLEISGHQKA